MDVRYQFVIYIMVVAFVGLLAVQFIKIRKPVDYDGGKKLAATEQFKKLKYYRGRMIFYRIFTVASMVTCMLGFICSCILVSRPYKEKIVTEQQYSRDIILCIDISTSVDSLNKSLVEKLKDTVEDLQGDRFGIVIFNTSPVVLCPLTDDYEYVIEQLDRIGECLDTRLSNDWMSDDYLEDCTYLESGTLVGNEDRGSSLIADGLASCAYDFTFNEGEEDRSRFIIFSTDNDPQGDSYVSLAEAADICSEKGIIVYGIGTKRMYSDAEDEMKSAVESTGGLFFLEEESGSVNSIVEKINAAQESLVDGDSYVYKVDSFATPFVLLVISVLLTYITRRIIRR